jgi:hypothetical protein
MLLRMNTCTKAIPNAIIRVDAEGIHIDVHWSPLNGTLDRPHTCGYLFDNTPARWALAMRLKKAIDAGAAITFKGILTDVNGKTYVDSDSKVYIRCIHSDLRRLGY